jgi:hypothetical protein
MTKGVYVVATFAVLTLCAAGASRAQLPQPQLVVDKPTAGMLPDASYMLRGVAGPESSFMLGFAVGLKQVVQLGASFGAQNVFGYGSLTLNDHVGFQARIRIVGEKERMPGLAVGFDSQGLGVYDGALERYDRKSPGFYAVASKNYALILGEFAMHGGLSWSLERQDDDDPTVYGGADWTLFERLSFQMVVDAAFNDDSANSFGEGGVYLDGRVGFTFGEYLELALAFRDLTGNFEAASGVSREFQITWIRLF